jgi:hypothetical protein
MMGKSKKGMRERNVLGGKIVGVVVVGVAWFFGISQRAAKHLAWSCVMGRRRTLGGNVTLLSGSRVGGLFIFWINFLVYNTDSLEHH